MIKASDFKKRFKLNPELWSYVKNLDTIKLEKYSRVMYIANTESEYMNLINQAKEQYLRLEVINHIHVGCSLEQFKMVIKYNHIKTYRKNGQRRITINDYKKYFVNNNKHIETEEKCVEYSVSKEMKEINELIQANNTNNIVEYNGKNYDLSKVNYNGSQLFEHQIEMLKLFITRMRDIYKEKPEFTKFVFQAATGSGKTVIELVPSIILNVPCIIMAPNEKIVDDVIATALKLNPRITISKVVQSQLESKAQITICTYQTLARRINPTFFGLVERIKKEHGYIVCDEAHHAICNSISTILDKCEGIPISGFTATPLRQNNKRTQHLSDFWLDVTRDNGAPIYQYTIGKGVLNNVLVMPELIVRNKKVDDDYAHNLNSEIRSGSNTSFSAYSASKKAQEEIYDTPEFHSLVVSQCDEVKSGKTIAFCVSRMQARNLSLYYKNAGWDSCYVEALTPRNERQEIYRKFNDAKAGTKIVLINCNVLGEGVDFPSCESIVLAKLFDSVASFVQAVGRGLRTFPGKNKCKIIDMAGNTQNIDMKYAIKFGFMNILQAKSNTNIGLDKVSQTQTKLASLVEPTSDIKFDRQQVDYNSEELLPSRHDLCYNSLNINGIRVVSIDIDSTKISVIYVNKNTSFYYFETNEEIVENFYITKKSEKLKSIEDWVNTVISTSEFKRNIFNDYNRDSITKPASSVLGNTLLKYIRKNDDTVDNVLSAFIACNSIEFSILSK